MSTPKNATARMLALAIAALSLWSVHGRTSSELPSSGAPPQVTPLVAAYDSLSTRRVHRSLLAPYECSDLSGCCQGNPVVTFPANITDIGINAFRGCSNLTSVIIPDSVTTIGQWAFYNCSRLTSVTIGAAVTDIGPFAFQYCSALTEVAIPDSVVTIGSAAFQYCSSLANLSVGSGLATFGNFSFHSCSALVSVVVPDAVTTIGNQVFRFCTRLTSVTIGKGVTRIGNFAFNSCPALASIVVPQAVLSIGITVFGGCTALTYVNVLSDYSPLPPDAFKSCSALSCLYGSSNQIPFPCQGCAVPSLGLCTVPPTSGPTAPSPSPTLRPSATPTAAQSASPSVPLHPSGEPSSVPIWPPAPRVASATLSDDGAGFTVLFDQPTDRGGLPDGSWSCSEVLELASAQSCSWLDASRISVGLGLRTGVTVNENITLADTRPIRRVCSGSSCYLYPAASRQTFALSPPSNPVAPVLDIRIAESIGPCDDFVIDASASHGMAGQPWAALKWTASGTGSSDFPAIEAALAARGSDLSVLIVLSSNASSALFAMGELRLTLSVTNAFGLSASATRVLSVTEDRNRPVVSIAAQSSVPMTARDDAFLQGVGRVSSCSDSPALTYSWSVYDSAMRLTSIRSMSHDNRAFKAPAYTFSPGNNYTVTLTARTGDSSGSASALLVVRSGEVVARIRGSGARDARWDQPLALDASASYDQDSEAPLRFSWTCLDAISGEDCSGLLPDARSGSTLDVNLTALSPGHALVFSVKCEASPTRFGTANVTVTVIPPSVPLITLSQSSFVVSPGAPLTIGAYVYGNFSCRAAWEASRLSSPQLSAVAVTPLSRDFSQGECMQNIAFSLGLTTSGFAAGSTYSFTLSVESTVDSASATASVSVRVRQRPSAGVLLVAPESGLGLETVFLLSSFGWVAASDAYPLSYAFGYSLLAGGTSVSVRLRMPRAHAETVLPSGLSESDNSVLALLQVLDAFDAAAGASRAVRVLPREHSYEDLDALLDRSLTLASSSSDWDSVLRSVSTITSAVTALRCSNAPNCTALSRESCVGSGVSNTCGPCLPSFSGTEGPSDQPCIAAPALRLGDPCTIGARCALGVCVLGRCADSEKPRTCASAVEGRVCSGHGSCRFADAYSSAVDRCMSSEGHCWATCVCEEEFGGADCGAPKAVRLRTISSACTYLKALAENLDSSIDVVSALVASLQQSFTDDELSSAPVVEVCIGALTTISSSLQSTVALDDAGRRTLSQALGVLSMLSTAVGRLARLASSMVEGRAFASRLDNVTRSIADSALSRMAPGQSHFELSSRYLKMSLHNRLLSTTAGLNFSASDSPSAATITIDSANGLGECGTFSGGYASFAVSEMSVLPYRNSESVTSGLVRWYSPESRGSDGSLERSASDRGNSNFTLRIPFTRTQAFYSVASSRFSNVTFPDCSVRQDEQFVPCECDLQSYNNNSATFYCSSLPSSICPREDGRLPGGGSRVSVDKQFSTVTTSLLRIFVLTLTQSSASSVDWQSAGPVFALFLFLLLAFVGGIVYFGRWDALDRRVVVYGLRSRVRERSARMSALPDAKLFVIRERYDELFRSGGEIDVNSSAFTDEDLELDRRWRCKLPLVSRFLMFVRSVRSSGTSLLRSSDSGHRFLQCLLRFHPFLWSFTGVSVSTTRMIRFVSLFKSFIISLFVSSLLYSLYYPADSNCGDNSSIADCLKAPAALASSTLCTWEASGLDEGSCSLRPPPSDFQFLVLVAVMSTLISLPLDVAVSLLLLLVCNKKPQWDALFGSGGSCEKTSDAMELREDRAAADMVLRSLRVLKHRAEESRDALLRDQYRVALDGFLSRLGLRFVGNDLTLDYANRVFFSDVNQAIDFHMRRTRLRGRAILREMEQFSYLGADAREAKQDRLLLRFTFEQLDFFAVRVIEPHLDQAFTPEPPLIHPVAWVASWLIVVGVNLFFIAWALLWGLGSNAATFRNWIANFLLETAWGCFISSIARVFVLNFLLLLLVRPSVVNTVNNVCDTVAELDVYEQEEDATFVSRALSPVCYAASRLKGSDRRLKAVYILQKLNDRDHCQIRLKTAAEEFPRPGRALRHKSSAAVGGESMPRDVISRGGVRQDSV